MDSLSVDTLETEFSTNSVDSALMLDWLESFQDTVTQSNSMVYSFWISVIAIGLIYFLKSCFIKVNPVGDVIMPVVMEDVIDLCVTLVPIIALGSIGAHRVSFGMFLILLTIVIVTICAYLRKKWGEAFTKGKCSYIYSIPCLVICTCYISFIYYYISISWNH